MKLFRLLFTKVTPLRNVSRTPIHNWYCTETATTTPTVSKRRPRKTEGLYRRIAPLGNPNVSVVPVLDQWLYEGRSFNLSCLRFIIKELRHYRRYIHALQYLKDEGEFERLNALIESLKDKCLISAKIHEKLVEYISGKCTIEDVFIEDSMEEVANK